MPSKPKAARTLLRPRQDFDQRQVPVTRQPSRSWFRVHRSGSSALLFGTFAYHRFSHSACPYPLLYMGATMQTCLWEVFGDEVFLEKRTIAKSKWEQRSISQITVPELKVCAVSLAPTRDAMGVDKASLLAADLAIPQAWGLAVQRHPAAFQAIKYTSRFIDQACLALFDRGGLQARLRVTHLGALNDLDAAVDWLHERQAALV
ncbi:MAG: RES domain-containing protein [Verrucomicrobiota bacterium]|jgi:hypothetical protein